MYSFLAAAKGMYGHHRYLKSPFLRNKKSQEEVQLLPEIGLARKHSGNSIEDASLVSANYVVELFRKNFMSNLSCVF